MFHRGVDFFPAVELLGQSYSTGGLREKKQPSPGEVEKIVGPEAEARSPEGYCFGGNGLAGKPARPFSFGTTPNLKFTLTWIVSHRILGEG